MYLKESHLRSWQRPRMMLLHVPCQQYQTPTSPVLVLYIRMPICPYYYTFSTSTWASDANGANNHSTAIAIKHDCARSPQNRSCSSIPFFQDKTFSDSCSHAIPKTATIPSGTYESYTASRIGIRTTLSRLTYASFHGVLLLPLCSSFLLDLGEADLVPRLACFDQRQVLTGGASLDRAISLIPFWGPAK